MGGNDAIWLVFAHAVSKLYEKNGKYHTRLRPRPTQTIENGERRKESRGALRNREKTRRKPKRKEKLKEGNHIFFFFYY